MILTRVVCTLCLIAVCARGGALEGELRVEAVDESGGALAGVPVTVASEALHVRRVAETSRTGLVRFRALPAGRYLITAAAEGLSETRQEVEISSELPVTVALTLRIAAASTSVTVRGEGTLLDPRDTAPPAHLGTQLIRERTGSLPSRGLIGLVEAQPGWVLEANGVLHPRGSEYQVQYVVDGVPLEDNRSPAFAPGLEPDTLQAVNVLTGAFPAEYGRKLGGVVELTTEREARPGTHGKVELETGSFSTHGAFAQVQHATPSGAIALMASGSETGRYLDPPSEGNFTNTGFTRNFAAYAERDLSANDRLRLSVSSGRSRFLVPNDLEQQAAGQRQDRDNAEIAGSAAYQHVFSPALLGMARLMIRDNRGLLWSNPLATPVRADQDRGFREVYTAASLAWDKGRHTFKAGGDAVVTRVHERFDAFAPDFERPFVFRGRRASEAEALFAQDRIRLGAWTISMGLRWDRYRFLVHDAAFSPRLGLAYALPRHGLVFRASYDRAFQTPAVEGLLLSSSAEAQRWNPGATGLAVAPSRANFFQAGFSKALAFRLRLDATVFERRIENFADDDVFLNTGVSFPISFASARVHGVEVKLDLPSWGPASGYVSYSNLTGKARLPVTGGLFLDAAATDLFLSRAEFPISQDERNTASTRFLVRVHPRVALGAGASYHSGLPVEREDDDASGGLLERFGTGIVSRVDLSRGRIRPWHTFDATAILELVRREHGGLRLQADAVNLANALNVINFTGALSGTALGVPRTVLVRLAADF